jgi:hypothetical protein
MAIDPKSAVFGGQEGSGLAQFLGDQPSAFETTQQPIQMLYNIKLQQQKQKDEEEKRKRDSIKKLGSFNALFDESQQELQTDFLALRELHSELWAEGIDPETDERFIKAKSEWDLKNSQNEAVWKTFEKVRSSLATGDYDEELAVQEMEKIMSQPKVGDRFNAVTGADILVKNARLFNDAAKFQVAPDVVEVDEAGRRKKTVKYDEAKVDENAKAYALSHPEEVDFYARKFGGGRDRETVTNEYVESLKPLLRQKPEVDSDKEIGKGGGFNLSIGGGTQNDKFNAIYANDPSISQVPADYNNYIAFGDYKTGLDLKPLELKGMDGTDRLIKVAGAQYIDMGKKKKEILADIDQESARLQDEIRKFQTQKTATGGSLTSKDRAVISSFIEQQNELKAAKERVNQLPNNQGWYMVGTRAKRPTGEIAEKMEADKQATGISYMQGDDGGYIQIFENVVDYMPISSRQGTTGAANLAKVQSVTDLNVGPEISRLENLGGQKQSASGGGTPAAQPKGGKSISAAEYKKLTAAELSKYKKNQDGTYSLR